MGIALLQSERKYRLLAESVNAVSWEFDLVRDCWTHVAPQVVRLLGYPPEEWRDFSWWKERIPAKWRERAAEYRLQMLREGNEYAFEYPLIHRNGSLVWLHDVISVDLEEGKPVRLRGIMIDITARKRLQEEEQGWARLDRVLGNVLNAMATKLQHVATGLRVSAENVSMGSARRSGGERQISQAAAEQKASGKEASGSVEEVSAIIIRNSNAAVDTAGLAGQLLTKLAPDIRKTAELVQEIASTAEELSSQAVLRDTIAFFKV